MSDRLTYNEYWTEIRDLAESIKEEVREAVRDGDSDPDISERIYETVDGHQWVIYTGYHHEVLSLTDNEDYGVDEGMIDANDSLKRGGMSDLTQALTYWAMYADIYDKMGNWSPDDDACEFCEMPYSDDEREEHEAKCDENPDNQDDGDGDDQEEAAA